MPHKPKDGVRARDARLVPARPARERRIHPQEETGRTLGAANVGLPRSIAGRERPGEERRKEERALREVHATFESAFANAPIGMALVDREGRWLQINDALCRITGYSREDLKATTLPAITHPDDADLDARFLRALVRGEIPNYQIEKRYRHAWGHYFWVLLTVSLVRDDDGEPLHVISQVQDISERKELAGRLEYLVDRDFLTGLFNRRHFEQELAKEVDRIARFGDTGAVLLMDLDHFKDVNDAFGHKAGDDLLKGIAGALKNRMRQTDVLARVGGDEFGVILPRTDAEEAQLVADAIVKTVARHVAMLGEQSIRTTASVGIALFDGMDAVEVLAVADLAMYEAKGAGRNRVSIYRRGDRSRERISARLAEAERIRESLDEDRFLLYGQPILDLKEKRVCQYELLLRLRVDEDAEPLPPSNFLYVAERFGLIREIDSWVALQAIALIAEHARAGRSLVLHVNLSGKSIGDPTVAGVIEDALAKAGIDPALLVFELTETAAIASIEEAKAFANRLRARGCRFALDDFGTGFASFYSLKTLPFDFFKIDGDFIRGLVGSPMDQLVVGAIVGIARGMGRKTIAEFVVDEETSCLLEKLGVDLAQGYHIGRPRPLTELLPAV